MVPMSSAGVETLVRTASGMGYWRGMNQIAGDTDYNYWYIIKLFYPPLVYYSCAIIITPYTLVYRLVLA